MTRKKSLILFLAGVLILTLHAYYFYPFAEDDAFISFRYVDRFLAGKGLTWTDGIPVEGYTNLLWILVLAVFRKITHMELWTLALILNYTFSIFSLWLMVSISNKLTNGNRTAAIWSCLLFALSSSLAIWINGGLEAPIIMFLLIIAANIILSDQLSLRRVIPAGILLGLVSIARADGILYSFAFSLAILSYEFDKLAAPAKKPLLASLEKIISKYWRILVAMNGMAVLFYLSQLAFRLKYYHEWVPNTALVKIAFSLTRIKEGIWYTLRMLVVYLPFVILLLPSLRKKGPERPAMLFFLVIIGVICIYLSIIGGDIFPGYRFVVPLVPFLCLSGGLVMMNFRINMPSKNLSYYFIAVLCFLFVVGIQIIDRRIQNGKKFRWEWDATGLGETLNKGFAQQGPTIGLTPAGACPYYSNLPSFDMLGLNDYYLPRHKPADFGSRQLAHGLGDAAYYFAQRPDIFLLGEGGLGEPSPFGSFETELFNYQGFQSQYVLTKLKIQTAHPLPFPMWQSGFKGTYPSHFTSYLFTKKYSSLIGIRALDKAEVIIPSYFLKNSGTPDSCSTFYLSNSGDFVIAIAPGESYFLDSNYSRGLANDHIVLNENLTQEIKRGNLLRASIANNELSLHNDGQDTVELKEIRMQNRK